MTYACSLLSFSIVSIKAGDTRSNLYRLNYNMLTKLKLEIYKEV